MNKNVRWWLFGFGLFVILIIFFYVFFYVIWYDVKDELNKIGVLI